MKIAVDRLGRSIMQNADNTILLKLIDRDGNPIDLAMPRDVAIGVSVILSAMLSPQADKFDVDDTPHLDGWALQEARQRGSVIVTLTDENGLPFRFIADAASAVHWCRRSASRASIRGADAGSRAPGISRVAPADTSEARCVSADRHTTKRTGYLNRH